VLEGKRVTKYFGGLPAVKDVDFQVEDKHIVGLIGPNGAGKTTLFNIISGIYPPGSGEISFKGKNITGMKTHDICRLGIGRTFQIVVPFLSMTVLENALVGVLHGKRRSIGMSDARRLAAERLEFAGLAGKKDLLASSLTIADRKRLEMVKALATEPELLLLDEVVAGLSPTETVEAMELIKRVRNDLGITIFWVEHVMKAVMGVVEKLIVLHHGEKIAEGTPQEVGNDAKVVDAYLGERYLF
jgi:branched-chain amino acid transport system ATP-binding protein